MAGRRDYGGDRPSSSSSGGYCNQPGASAFGESALSGSPKFERRRQDCLRKGEPFKDRDFPAKASSAFFSLQKKHRAFRIEWKRPHEIARSNPPRLFEDVVERFDVNQGKLGDCWVLAALACMSDPDHRHLFDHLVPPGQSFDERWYIGIFHFKFWHLGKREEVIIDDLLPTRDGKLIFTRSSQSNEFWAALVEKAYAKLYGSYEAIEGGLMADAFADFTGGVAETYRIRGPGATDQNYVRRILLKAIKRKSLIGCGIFGGSEDVQGLISGHAYSLTDMKEVTMKSGEQVTLVRVRNPWGNKKEWDGPWGDRSHEWMKLKETDMAKLGLVRRDDGEFWMTFQDFLKHFDCVDICNLKPACPEGVSCHWYSEDFRGRWRKGSSAGGPPTKRTHWNNPQYLVELSVPDEDDYTSCSFLIQLLQSDRQEGGGRKRKLEKIGFTIYEWTRSGQPQTVASSGDHVRRRQVVRRFALPRGNYVVVPSTRHAEREADFYIRFFFEEGNSARKMRQTGGT